jgi:hypothetical protein
MSIQITSKRSPGGCPEAGTITSRRRLKGENPAEKVVKKLLAFSEFDVKLTGSVSFEIEV